MDIKWTQILVLVLCAGMFFRAAVADQQDNSKEMEYDEGDYNNYNYDDYNNKDTPMDDPPEPSEAVGLTETPSVGPTTKPLYTTTLPEDILNDSIAQHPTCPFPCSCENGRTQFVNCSSRDLTQIPDIPYDVIGLDLSHNRLDTIPSNSFDNTTALKDLRLSFNRIATFEPNTFLRASRLENLDLTANAIKHIDPDTFNGSSLSSLSLAQNPLELRSDQVLLNLPKLEKLNLGACNLTTVYYDTFRNLTGLTALDMQNNSFGENLYVAAFKNMTKLKRLNLDALRSSDIHELCELLEGIDVINFSKNGVSCFEFMAGSTFEESVVTQPPLIKLTYSTEEAKTTTTTTRPTTTTKASTTTSPTTASTKPIVLNSVTDNNTRSDFKLDSTDKLLADQSNTTSNAGQSSNKVQVSSSTLRHILIGIIVVAFVGLAIGLCCRRDIFGIKTKLCRTSVRGPTATDQVRPAEQVPLKEIEMRELKKEVV